MLLSMTRGAWDPADVANTLNRPATRCLDGYVRVSQVAGAPVSVFHHPTRAAPADRGVGFPRVIGPETCVVDATATQLAEVIGALIDGGAFDDLGEVDRHDFRSASRARERADCATPEQAGAALSTSPGALMCLAVNGASRYLRLSANPS